MSEAPAVYAPPADRLSLGADDLRALGLDFAGGFVLPVLPGRLEFAWIVRAAIERLGATAIAVLLPEGLAAAMIQAVARLPRLSVVTVPSPGAHGRPLHWVIEPADPVVEAIRRAGELGLGLHFVDRDVDRPAAATLTLPDPLAAEHVGAALYLEAALAAAALAGAGVDRSAEEDAREATIARGIAAAIAGAGEDGVDPCVLVIGELAGARRLAARLRREGGGATPALVLRRRNLAGVTVSHLAEASSQEILAELPFLNAAFERARAGASVGAGAPVGDGGGDDTEEADAEGLAEIVDLFARRAGGGHGGASRENAPTSAPRENAPSLGPASPAATALCGRIALLVALCREARARYRRTLDADLRPGTIAALLRYACRYALTEGDLGPELYHLVIAARGFVDDTFAQELWEAATAYPWQSAAPEVPALELGLRELHGRVRTVRFRPRMLPRRRGLRIIGPRPRERRPGEWAERFTDGICSHPPEDLALEAYGAHLRGRADRLIQAAATRTVRFQATLGDGVDVRETVRNWHTGALYVRLDHPVRDHAGPVVVIFEDEPVDTLEPKYPWHMTWQGESDEEGDMALYATDPMERVIGPGIGRALYGGFLLCRPAEALFGVWDEPELFDDARTKGELLLLAALEHARARIVVHVAAKPPRPRLRRLAAAMDRKIVHIPLGQLSPVTLKKVRTLHVLSDAEARRSAHLYLR